VLNHKHRSICALALVILTFASTTVRAQFYNLPNDYFFSLLTERELAKKDPQVHSDIKPYIHFLNKKYIHRADSHRIFKYITEDPALDVTFFKHVLSFEPKNENFKIHVDPIVGFVNGRDLVDTTAQRYIVNTRGIIAQVYIGKDFYAESMFVENQAFLPDYAAQYCTATGVVPGQGRYKAFKKYGFDYAFSSGFISYSPWKNFNVQAGHGKHKIGNGYRSLLLSDNAFNYPYARVTEQLFGGKLQYTAMYAVLMNLVSATVKPVPNAERLFQKKPFAFQHLSWNVTKEFNVSFFQGIVFRAGNSVNKPQLDLMYASPVIYSHAAYYGLNDSNNVIVGADVKLKITDKIGFYSQLMADNLKDTSKLGNSYGYQLGLTYYDALGVKNLFFQAEYNFVNENSYRSPKSVSDQSYSHYNQNLAYTPGYGNELVLLADHKYKRFFGNFRYHLQNKPLNGKNFTTVNIVNTNLGYLINPAYNLNVYIGYNYRFQKFYNFNPGMTSSFIYFGFKTNLFNAYYDF
jgi:hypothetical protein